MSMFMPVGGKPFEKIICGASGYMGTLRRSALLGGGGGAGVRSPSAIPPYIDMPPEKKSVHTAIYRNKYMRVANRLSRCLIVRHNSNDYF